jgi:hypothetical protein
MSSSWKHKKGHAPVAKSKTTHNLCELRCLKGPRNVRFTPNSGHSGRLAACPLCANSGHHVVYSAPADLAIHKRAPGAKRACNIAGSPGAFRVGAYLFLIQLWNATASTELIERSLAPRPPLLQRAGGLGSRLPLRIIAAAFFFFMVGPISAVTLAAGQ